MNRRVWSFVLEAVAVLLLSVTVFGVFGPFWALIPLAVYLLFVSFTMFGGPE